MPETIEAPEKAAPVAEAEVPASQPAEVVHTFTSALDELKIIAPGTVPPPEKKSEAVEVDPEKIKANLSPKARDNFAKLEEAKKAAEAERDKFKTEFETTQARLKEYEEKLKTVPNADEFTAKEQQYQEQLQKLQGELKFAALERDPDFIARYETPKTVLQQTLQDMALSTGATADDFQRAVKLGLSDRLDEIRESLPSHTQRRWDAALTQIEAVQLQRELALKDRDRTYEEILQQRQQNWQQEASQKASQQLQQNISLAHRLADEPFEKIAALKDNDELRNEVRSTLEAIAGGKGADKWSAEQIMREFAASVVQRHILQTQHTLIEGTNKELAETKAKLEEAEKKLAERETYMQGRFNSQPHNEVPGSNGVKESSGKASWEDIVIQPR